MKDLLPSSILDERYRMKDKRLVTFIYEFQSQNYLVFYLVSLIFHPNSVLNPLSKLT